ncbi:MAG: hypothetical protein J0I20_35345 [Chloroflexi bacterium]|nr:hypothetical protein [Chloroflexota bacterium]
MKKPPKGNLSLFATIAFVVGTCLVTGGILFVINSKTAWVDAPLYSGALNVKTTVSGNGSVKTTTFNTHEYYTHLADIYLLELNFHNWFEINFQGSPVLKATLTYVDGSKNLEIPDFFTIYQNNCPAFYLDVTIENVTRFDSNITTVQTVGPCGNPIS